MMARRLAIFALMFSQATAVLADVPRPETTLDTLMLMDAAIRQADPELNIVVDEGAVNLKVVLPDGTEAAINPDNLHINLQAASDDAARSAVLGDFVANTLDAVSGMSETSSADMPLDRVMPVLRAYDFLQEPEASTLPTTEFPGGLTVYWVIDQLTSTQSVSDEQLAASGLTQAELGARALENLRKRAEDIQLVDMGGSTGIVLDGYYESSLLLLPEFWQDIDTRLGTVVAAPLARDVVIYLDGDDAAAVANVRDIVRTQFGQVAYPVSSDLFRWDGDHWTVLP
jgi:uncharacterized protein YtpQ (UPF0354 family)